MTLFDLLARSAAKKPDAPALHHHDHVISYGDLLATVEGFAGGLASLNISKRGRIAILLPNCPAFVIAYYAASRAGATVVPMNILYRPDEARYILADADVEAIITAESFRPLVKALRPMLPNMKHVIMVSNNEVEADELSFYRLCGSSPAPKVSLSERDVAVILYTSGTTGRPKGAMLTFRNLIANSESCLDVLQIVPEDRFFAALPLFHTFAATICLNLAILVGASLVLQERFLPSHALKTMESSRATIFAGVPSMFGLMLQVAREHPVDLSALRICISGGAPLPPEVWTAFEEAFDVKMAEGYGLTEASPVVAVNPPFGIRKVGSIGLPISNVRVKIVDPTGRAVPTGMIGELAVKGANVMKGYLRKPAETKEVIRRGWLFTGDLARMDEDGYLYIVGRKKEVIIVGGLNVYPGEVERVLVEHPAILEVAAFGITDSSRGEAVWAAVVLRPGETVTVKELQALCREKLASYKVPRGIEILQELPKNALGKIMRHVLHNQVMQERNQPKPGNTSDRELVEV
ncbi:MAG TPA: long-chain fatty acid--CoA ligase [Armatimonadota bacterium]|nr:long-chain fatty acid--CoA ligase [Armatimonadota bacterium]